MARSVFYKKRMVDRAGQRGYNRNTAECRKQESAPIVTTARFYAEIQEGMAWSFMKI